MNMRWQFSLERGATIIRLDSRARGSSWIPLSLFSFEYFWMRGGIFFCDVWGVKNEHDGDHYLETHSLLTSSSNNTHREWLRSLFGISRRARDNGVSLEMSWTGDTITISQSVVVVETQLQIHLFPFGLKVMYDLKQQRNCWSLPERATTVLDDYTRLFINIGTSQNEKIAMSRQLKNIIRALHSRAATSLNDISNSLAPIPSL